MGDILTPRQLTDGSRILIGSCHDVLGKIAPGSIHCTVTSPPYDDLRNYKGKWSVDLKRLGEQIKRATVVGGAAIVVIQDARKNGLRSGTSIRMAAAWMEMGWRLFDDLVYRRGGIPGIFPTCFRGDHEHVFVFCNGEKLRAFDKSTTFIPTSRPGKTRSSGSTGHLGKDGWVKNKPGKVLINPATMCRGTVWDYRGTVTEANPTKFRHPATFPDRLCQDLVQTFSRPGDMVLDPFLGSGTTAVIAAKHGRYFTGIEISPEYVEIAKDRLYKESPIDGKRLRVDIAGISTPTPAP